MRKYYPGITLFKFIGSILIVLTHIIIPAFFQKEYSHFSYLSLTNITIPCFFITSGFLASKGWSNADNADKYIAKYLLRLILLYCLCILLFIATDLIYDSGKVTRYFTFSNAKRFLVLIFLQGPFSQLWFIPPLIFGITASYYLVSKKSISTVVFVGAAAFIITLFTSGGLQLLTKDVWNGNYFHFHFGLIALREIIKSYLGKGLVFVLTGIMIAKYEERFLKLKPLKLIILSVCVTLPEYFLFRSLPANVANQSLSLSVLPNSLLLFYWILHIKTNWIKPYHQVINLFTIVIYFSHFALIIVNIWIMHLKVTETSISQAACLIILTFTEGVIITYLVTLFGKYKSKPIITAA